MRLASENEEVRISNEQKPTASSCNLIHSAFFLSTLCRDRKNRRCNRIKLDHIKLCGTEATREQYGKADRRIRRRCFRFRLMRSSPLDPQRTACLSALLPMSIASSSNLATPAPMVSKYFRSISSSRFRHRAITSSEPLQKKRALNG